MVVVDESLHDQLTARRLIRSLGVSDGIIDDAERANPGLDWLSILHALDGIFLSYGGAMGQVLFLRAPQPALDGRTPLEAIVNADGARVFCQAARLFASTSGR
jgi:Protein of unknown function (DUF2384)